MVASTGFAQFDVPADIVDENLVQMNQRVDTQLAQVQEVIDDLTDLNFDIIATPPPEFALVDPEVPPVVAPTPPTGGLQFGEVEPWSDPGYVDLSVAAGIGENLILVPGAFVPTVGAPVFPEPLGELDLSGAPTKPGINTEFEEPSDPGSFDASGQPTHPTLVAVPLPTDPGAIDLSGEPTAPTARAITLPTAPSDITIGDSPVRPEFLELDQPTAPGAVDTSGLPTRPDVTVPTLPADPVFTAPDAPVFIELNLPTVPDYNIPAFEGERPEFDGVRPTDTFSWVEPTYSGPLLSEVESKVSFVLAGNTALTTAVQNALFSAARDREDSAGLAFIQDASDEWGGRGFSMPPGMLNKTILAAREKVLLQSNGLSREILTKVATWTREDVMAAITHAIGIETMLHGWFEAATERSFQVAKYHLEVEMKLYESAIALFNAKQSAYQTDAVVFGKLIEAELGKLSVFKAQIEGEIAKGQINEQRIKLYLGQWEGVKAVISVFEAQMKGRQSIADTNRAILEGYGADVKAYHEIMDARKVPYEVFDSQMKGVQATADVNRALAAVFGADVDAYGKGLEAKKIPIQIWETEMKGQQTIADINRSEAEVFASQVRAHQTTLEARKVPLEVYQAQLKAAETLVSYNRNLVEMFGMDTAAWRATLDARKVPFEIYAQRLQNRKTEVEAERLIVDLFSAETKNYAETLAARKTAWEAQKLNFEMEGIRQQAYESQVRAYTEEIRGSSIEKENKATFVNLKIAAMRASTEKYSATLVAERERVQSELATIESRVKTFVADTGRYSAEIHGQTEAQRTSFQFTQSEERIRLEFYSLRLKEYDAALARQQHRTDQMLEGIKAAGQYGTALAAGFASSIHVQAGISGQGSASVQDYYPHETRP